MRALLSFLVALVLAGCGLDPAKVPVHHPYAKDGERREASTAVTFAVVGSTRATGGGKGDAAVPHALIEDIRGEIPMRGIEMVVLTGGQVRRSTSGEWRAFGSRWGDVLAGDTPSDNKGRKSVLALPGRGEYAGDRRLVGYGTAFSDPGVEIGHNRVASWGHFDVVAGGKTWRLLFLDTHRKELGSRWKEQLFWLPRVVGGNDFDRLLVFLPDARITLARGAKMDPDDAVTELLAVIEDHTGVMKLAAVITGGSGSNELYLPGGAFGEAYLVAGNAGVPAQTLQRWGPADDAGYKDLTLEPGFDGALMKEFDRWSEALSFPERVVDEAKSTGTYKGYTAAYQAGSFPVRGWWVVTLDGGDMSATFRMRRHDGAFHDLYTLAWRDAKGWSGRSGK